MTSPSPVVTSAGSVFGTAAYMSPEQGTADTTVLPPFTQQLTGALKATEKTYDGLTHSTVVTSAAPQVDATAYIKKKLG